MAYFADFDHPGTWYLWIRGLGDTVNREGSDDSLHAGLNGSLSSKADNINTFPASWTWSSNTKDGIRASLEIPSAGIHAVNLWMREDGLAVDKILLTTDANYEPTGEGEAASDKVSVPDNTEPASTDTVANATLVDDEITVEVTTTGITDITVDDTAMNPADNTPAVSTENTVDDSTSSSSDTSETTGGGGGFGTSLMLMVIVVWRRASSLKNERLDLL